MGKKEELFLQFKRETMKKGRTCRLCYCCYRQVSFDSFHPNHHTLLSRLHTNTHTHSHIYLETRMCMCVDREPDGRNNKNVDLCALSLICWNLILQGMKKKLDWSHRQD